ncbi:MAG: ATP-grasp domain-containing protein [Ruminococcus sp.]|nr:ATP-grasp domain-containing protein [Candidatus Copronaster equi]
MKKIMVLGAGRGQIPIIELAKKYDCEVVAVSPEGNYPGLKIADKVIYENVKDMEKVLCVAQEEQIDGIVTDQLDAGVLTCSYVAEKMGIKGIGYNTALKFTDKFEMRKAAFEAGVAVPEFVSVSSPDDFYKIDKLGFPLIMKPVDSSASRGVKRVENFEEFKAYYDFTRNYSKSGQVIVEKLLSGKEFVVEAFTKSNRITNLCIGHRDYFDIPGTFIPNATVFLDAQSANSDVEKKILETNEKLIKAYGLPFGITHGEYIYDDKTDTVYLVEIAARGGGVFISSELIPACCSVNANDLLIREVLGIDNDKEIEIKKGSSAYFCYLTPNGIVSRLDDIDKVERIDGVVKAFFDNIELGAVSKSILDKSSRKGPILVKGLTKEDCYNVIDKIKKTVKIEVTENKDVKNIIWN